MPLAIGARLGPFEITGKLGAGGMGEVYRARDTNLGRDVAVKVLPDSLAGEVERQARFRREAQILATLNHPNIATIYGWEDSGEAPAVIMELVDGRSLRELIGRRGMPLPEALQYAFQMARGLEAAHRVGVVHRDLKPSNVIVKPSGDVKILDFGLAKLVELSTTDPSVTATLTETQTTKGRIVGTVAYMSPEQAQGKPVDPRSDVFSFGTVFYEMLTGRQPFLGEDQVSTLVAILREQPRPASEVTEAVFPRDVEHILSRCLRKDPERRFQSASDLRAALADVNDALSSGQLEPAVAVYRAARARPAWIGLGLLAALLLGGAAGAWWILSHRTTASRPMKQLTFEAGMALMPALSPDGKLLAYVSDRSGEGHPDIWLKQMAGGEPIRRTFDAAGVSDPQFSADGTTIYYLGPGGVWEVPTLGGPARRVVDRAGPFSVSARGDIAFFRPGPGFTAGPVAIMPAGGGPQESWQSGCKSVVPPTWSPDGLRIAILGVCGAGLNSNEIGFYWAPRQGGAPQRIPIMIGRAFPVGISFWKRIVWVRWPNGAESLIVPRDNGDSVNLSRLDLSGRLTPLTQGAGWETSPVLSANGGLVFARSDVTPTIWSLPLNAGPGELPRRETAPALSFSVSHDGTNLAFGRVLGTEQGQLILHNRVTGAEEILASHRTRGEGAGLWAQVSPDGSQVVYRLIADEGPAHWLVSAGGGTPRRLIEFNDFNLGSDWFPDSRTIIGECQPPSKGICALDPSSGAVRLVARDPAGGELLYPGWSWDGKWMVFMRRRGGQTVIWVAPAREDGSLGPEPDWVPISPDGAISSRARFAPDGAAVFYLLEQNGARALVRQPLDPATKRPVGALARVAALQVIPPSLANALGAPISTVAVSRDRVFYNTVEVRGNVWMME